MWTFFEKYFFCIGAYPVILPLSSIKADGVGVSIYVLITVLSARLRPIAILSGESLGYHRISGVDLRGYYSVQTSYRLWELLVNF